MKGAVLYSLGTPKYADIDEPVPQNDQQVVVKVLASTVKQLDISRSNGRHYLPYKDFPCTVGVDGVAQLDDGTLIYCWGITGMIAEKALVTKGKWVVLDKDTDPLAAAALPNAVLGAGMALKIRGQIKEGDTVLINGATGFTGKAAVQLAKIYGAKRVIATGRNQASLDELKNNLGADEIISLAQTDEAIISQVKKLHAESPISVVIDYIWGKPAELVLTGLIGTGHDYQQVRYVSVGEMAGPTVNVKSSLLRSTAIEILGSGLGSFPAGAIEKFNVENLNSLLQTVKSGQLKLHLKVVDLKDIESNWGGQPDEGRIVVKIQ
ncbi:zinc-containing alcohol dehydrogenase [Heterostelium album PN500]|uniref:Zinc-containing alcohol dehydrogenase n=1 Tax=Heterostelium pallidum (strain ATCC 26659 / Pp 5 / PN500) TaxID=670386 RepID=D3BMC1_HETP5|nr:zinc-containing alcohol dehydrogenase [Heterostelium album PN500]EFA77722.1 zinc-containing alcohol dehydrogenase [Heterostelium album PN500]|eukprot:XP_020429850.1 zinc-containing alcohol dehydrogenase [Heterostelium album PN500]